MKNQENYKNISEKAIEAIQSGDILNVAMFISELDPKSTFQFGKRHIFIATKDQNIEMIKYLLECGAKPCKRSINYALRKANYEIVKMLSSHVYSEYVFDNIVGKNDVDLVVHMLRNGYFPSDFSLDLAISKKYKKMSTILFFCGAGFSIDEIILAMKKNECVELGVICGGYGRFHDHRKKIFNVTTISNVRINVNKLFNNFLTSSYFLFHVSVCPSIKHSIKCSKNIEPQIRITVYWDRFIWTNKEGFTWTGFLEHIIKNFIKYLCKE